MNLKQMEYRCPDAKVIDVGTLKNYELVFHYCADVNKKARCEVPIVIWDISDEDEKNLDFYEGYPSLYIKVKATAIQRNGDKIDGFLYTMNDKHKVLEKPSISYFNGILEGYIANGIDVKPLFKALKPFNCEMEFASLKKKNA